MPAKASTEGGGVDAEVAGDLPQRIAVGVRDGDGVEAW